MKIPKLFKKAAFAMAAVTALSVIPATTAFAAGDIGTISFLNTYDGNGNAMRYNSSANIGGYTAGGTGTYKYRMFVDGDVGFCLQPGVPLKTGNTLKRASSEAWNALSASQKKVLICTLLSLVFCTLFSLIKRIPCIFSYSPAHIFLRNLYSFFSMQKRKKSMPLRHAL